MCIRDRHKINCPNCGNNRKKKNQKTLSVHVDSDKIKYQCWHCDLTGSINFNINYGDKAKVVDMFNPDKEKETWQDLGTSAINFFKNRGISKKTAEHFHIKQKKNYIASFGEVDCIVFPYGNDANIKFAKIRSCVGKGFASQGSAEQFYNHEIIDDLVDKEDSELIICEGELDCLSYFESGISNCVSIPSGAVNKVVNGKTHAHEDTKFKFIWNSIEKLNKINRIVISMDNDTAGNAMAEELARRIGTVSYTHLTLPTKRIV